jgi:hypothetical protein
MNTYRITLERISTGEKAPSMIVRQPSEEAAREYAEKAIAGQLDLRVAEIAAR